MTPLLVCGAPQARTTVVSLAETLCSLVTGSVKKVVTISTSNLLHCYFTSHHLLHQFFKVQFSRVSCQLVPQHNHCSKCDKQYMQSKIVFRQEINPLLYPTVQKPTVNISHVFKSVFSSSFFLPFFFWGGGGGPKLPPPPLTVAMRSS